MFARLTSSLAFACFVLPAMASALALLPLRRSGECPEGDASNEHCHPDSGFSTTKIIIIIVSCSAFVLLMVCALLFYFYKHPRYRSVAAPPPFPAQDGVFSSHSEMGYAGPDPHFPRAKKKSYTPTTSTLSTGSSTLGGPPPSPPLPQAMYGFSHGAI